jgi:DNA-binding response OmpR family regulator
MKFTLPFSESGYEPLSGDQQSSEESSVPEEGGIRVLVAEDDPVLLEMYDASLKSFGHTPLLAINGQAALDLFDRERPPLVILDLVMPLVDGTDVCRHIRAREDGRDTFILIVTGHDGTSTLDAVLDAGADDYLAKPVTADQLRARVAIAGRSIIQRRARRAAEEALARAQWLAGIGETSLALQHEVNNPLTALLGNAALLAMREYSPEEEREFVEAIVEQANRIGAVVQRLSSLKDPQSVSYIRGTKMLDLSPRTPTAQESDSSERRTGHARGDGDAA